MNVPHLFKQQLAQAFRAKDIAKIKELNASLLIMINRREWDARI
jgi:hypothetical protein